MVKTNLSKEEFKDASELTEKQRKELVDKYTKLRSTIMILEKESEEVKSKLIEYSLFKEKDELEGTNRSLTVNKLETFGFPTKSELKPLNQYLKKKDLWELFSEIDKNKLVKAIKEKKFNDETLSELKNFLEEKTIYRLVFDKKE